MKETTQSLTKALALLRAIADAGGERSLTSIARALAIPLSTAHRLAVTLAAHGLIVQEKRGYFHAGLGLTALASRVDPHRIFADVSRPLLRRLAQNCKQTAHLGMLESDMVTYLVREPVGRGAIFTRVGCQLEGYCTGIGKVILAHLPPDALEDYIASGPFVQMTANTITDIDAFRAELMRTRERGYGIDDGEMEPGLECIAMPLADRDGRVHAAISVSGSLGTLSVHDKDRLLLALRDTQAQIGERLFPSFPADRNMPDDRSGPGDMAGAARA